MMTEVVMIEPKKNDFLRVLVIGSLRNGTDLRKKILNEKLSQFELES
jgi:hypothetical protein